MKIRIGIIGIGSFCSKYHIPHFLRRSDVEVTAVCDISPERLQGRGEALRHAQTFTDYRDLLDPDLIDGALVSTPNSLHFGPAKRALECGIPVMVDKPLTRTAPHAEELVHLSRSRNCVLMTAFTRHFMASAVHVRRQIVSGDAGHLQMACGIQRYYPGKQPELNGGMLLSRSVHILDIIPWLTGQKIAGVEGRVDYGDHGYETFVDVHLALEGGAPARLLGIKECASYQDEVTIYSAKQSFRLERQQLYTEVRGGWSPVEDLPECGNSTSHFCDVVQKKLTALENSPTNLNGEDGLRSIRAVEAIEKAGRTGRFVEL